MRSTGSCYGVTICFITGIYRVSRIKWNGGFSVLYLLKVDNIFTSVGKALSTEENDTKIIEFGEVIFDSMPIT